MVQRGTHYDTTLAQMGRLARGMHAQVRKTAPQSRSVVTTVLAHKENNGSRTWTSREALEHGLDELCVRFTQPSLNCRFSVAFAAGCWPRVLVRLVGNV